MEYYAFSHHFFWCIEGRGCENDKPGCRPCDVYDVGTRHSRLSSFGCPGPLLRNTSGGAMSYVRLSEVLSLNPCFNTVQPCDLVQVNEPL